MPEKSIVEQIKHYQRDIVKCPGDSKRMIRCIERLTVLPITIAHLQETGVGRSVNELRKCGGEVGAAASSLVCKWKSMVKDSDSEEESEIEDSVENVKSVTDHKNSNSNPRNDSSQKHKNTHSSDYHKKSVSSHNTHSKTESRNRETSKDSSHHKSSSRSSEKSHRDSSTKTGYGSSTEQKHLKQSSSHRSKTDYTSKSHKSISSHESQTDRNGTSDKNTKIKYDKSKSSKHNSDPVFSDDSKVKNDKHNDYKDKPRKEDKSSVHKSSKKYDLKKMESDSSDDEVYKPSSKKQKTVDSDEEQSYKNSSKQSKASIKKRVSSDESDSKSESEEETDNEEKVHIESDDNRDSDDRSCSENNISDDEQPTSARESDNVSETSDRDSEEESRSESDNDSPEEEYIPVKIKKEKEKPEREFKSYSSNEKSLSNHVKNKYTSHSLDKSIVKQEKDESIKIKKEKDDKHRKNTHSQKEDKNGSDGKKYKDGKSRSHSESSTKEPKSEKKVKIKIEKEDDGSIDCVSGASFADALLGLSDSKKKQAKRKTSSPSLEKQSRTVEKSTGSKIKSSSKSDGRPSTSSSASSKTSFKELDLLSKNIKLEPLDVDLNATLPEITPNYKPLPHFSPPSSPPNKRAKFMSQEDALSTIMSTKNQRTKVFSGNRTGYTKVPSLFDLCIQVLQNNIEGLEYTGGVPYDLLKPVLDRATADQLHQLEYYNPYLVEDTDSLWKFHCKKEFRGKEPEEFETWRELYLRSLDERERKLKALKENITQSIAKSTPIRQTKLAYIDSVVKPPRNVARQQMKMGTGKPVKHEIVSKAMVGAASGPPSSEAVSVPAPPRTNSSNSQFPIPNFLKKKKAPLMAKALQLIKGNRFKR